jgi:hypothetical protein
MKHLRLAATVLSLLYLPTVALGADAPATTRASDSKALANPLAALSLDKLSASVDRPLFSPSRRPPSPAPVRQDFQLPAVESPPPDLVLSGVVMDGEGARVVVLVGAEKRVLRAQMGDEIDGWKVVQIDGRKLVLSLNGRFVTFTLFNRDVDQRNLGDGTASKAGNASQPSLQQILSPANRNARN